MVTENWSFAAGRTGIILGSGLSGMVAAYISARALEDNARHDVTWQAKQAFRPRFRAWRERRLAAHRGTAVVS